MDELQKIRSKDQLKKDPKTSIVVVHWEQEALTSDCLSSLKKIPRTDLEIILVDNGSRDGSGQRLADTFPHVVFIGTEENNGYAAGVNEGIRVSLQRGADYIFIMNNDTIVDPGIVNCFLGFMEDPESSGVGICVPKIYYHDRPGIIWYAGGECDPTNGLCRHWNIGSKDEHIHEEPAEITFANGCSMFIKREVIERVGYFDEHYFHTGEDADYSIRTMRAGYRLIYIPKARLWHRARASTKGSGGGKNYIYYEYRNRMILWSRHFRKKGFRPKIKLAKFYLRSTLSEMKKGNYEASLAIMVGLIDGLRGVVGKRVA